ncbi:hypothetical protein H5410_014362 [Solanum commersonii]|uniref:Glycosyl hydrolase family 63 C-terminal domain-containing protein n=1 Tax=Solanum commersonii TaxID=4109 RepID=A0A9J5ZR59_SOLCO|nr:hypothetical protein H5410_014362 [Solanum commersonii]
MNIDGWIPRELILGAEALSKVPEEFVLQHPTNGNPPTLFLALRDLISKLNKEKFAATEARDISVFLDRAFVHLEAWFKWFNTTQAGKEMGSYYWHGRDTATTREINPKVQLTWKIVETGSNYPRREFVREVLEKPVLQLVPHLGYVSLFPFILRLIPPDSWILESQLHLISNKSILWTDFGLRSLSKTSSMYMKRNTEHDPPYWRGPIWIPLNILNSDVYNY